MLKVYLTILIALFSSTIFSQDAQFEFRNDDRPSFDQITTISQLSEKQGQKNLIILDVRLKEDFEKDPLLIPGASYFDPENLPEWSKSLPSDSEVIVYCVAGKWVSHKVAYLLNEKGINVSILAGGIEAWKKSND
ncbi:MAG: hypothetical protein COA86_01315 [Kangiella sp.]|nr:MAG: hypothetical protein COA86_01315 [Kangiella sp.]